jgi:hypothetical protein
MVQGLEKHGRAGNSPPLFSGRSQRDKDKVAKHARTDTIDTCGMDKEYDLAFALLWIVNNPYGKLFITAVGLEGDPR